MAHWTKAFLALVLAGLAVAGLVTVTFSAGYHFTVKWGKGIGAAPYDYYEKHDEEYGEIELRNESLPA